MSIRRDIIEQLTDQPHITLSRTAKRHAEEHIEAALTAYADARRERLLYELGLHFRVAIFGSARLTSDTPEFVFVTELTRRLVEARKMDIVTGGDVGIMQAANRGIQLALAAHTDFHAKAHALPIQIPWEEGGVVNAHFEKEHPEFSTRLQDFIDKTQAAYIAPGGIGTLLEMLMLVQCRQVDHIESTYPIIAHPIFRPVIEQMYETLYHARIRAGEAPLVSERDLAIVQFSDDIDEIVRIFTERYDAWHILHEHVEIGE